MNTRRASIVLSLAIALAGCASRPDTVVFVTKSSLGLDVEQTPPSASIAYDRVEGYFGPRYESGAVAPVVAVFMTNGQLLDRRVKQLYATGDAARTLLAPAEPVASDPKQEGDFKPMFFGTSTTVGLKIGYEAGGSTSTFTLGYKRKELSVIPVNEGRFPAVLATLQTDVDARGATGSSFGAGQLFATGAAATALAARQDVREIFIDKAEAALDDYRSEERQQSRHALVTLGCLAALPDAKLPAVWRNAEALGVLDKEAGVGTFASLGPDAARERYTSHLALLDADSADATTRLSLHRQYVCGLAGR